MAGEPVAWKDTIGNLYKTYLGREPDQQGSDYWYRIGVENRWNPDQLGEAFKNAAKEEIQGSTDPSKYPISQINTAKDVQQYQEGVTQKQQLADLTKQMGDYFKPNPNGELTPEAINQYADIVKQSLQPEFNKQAQGLSEQYAAMGRDLGGDAYNRALAKLGGDFQSKQFEQSLGLAQANIGTKNQNLQNYLGLANNQKSASDAQKFDWQNILSNNDWSKQLGLANTMADAQNRNKTPDWAYWLQLIPSIAKIVA